jgi:hypothetical protein
LKDEVSTVRTLVFTAVEICDKAMQHDSTVVASTYNKPLITSEWVVEVFQVSKTRGRGKAYV